MRLREIIFYIVERRPGITDRELSESIFGSDARHQQINAECRLWAQIERRRGQKYIQNYLIG